MVRNMKCGLFLFIMLFNIGFMSTLLAQDAEDVESATYLFYFVPPGNPIAGLAVKSDGNILVASAGGSITEFNSYGELANTFEADASGNSFGQISSIHLTPAGNLYVASLEPDVINLYDPEWNVLQTIETSGRDGGQSVAYDATNETLYVIIDREVVAFNADGEKENSFGLQITTEADYILDGSLTINPDGNVIYGFGGSSRAIKNIDAVAGAIQVYQPDGALLSEMQTEYAEEELQTTAGVEIFRFFPVPYGLIADSTGRFYSYMVTLKPPAEPGKGARSSGFATITAPNGTLLRQFTVSQQAPAGAVFALSPDEKTLYISTEGIVNVVALTTEPPFTTVKLTDNGRLRATPVDGAVVDSLEAGTILIVIGQNDAGDWLQVRHEGADVWIAKFLTGPVSP